MVMSIITLPVALAYLILRALGGSLRVKESAAA